MGKRLPNDASNWGSDGGKMRKHARSGTPHNHRVTIEMNREAARQFEKEAEIRKKQKGTMYPSVSDVFKNVR